MRLIILLSLLIGTAVQAQTKPAFRLYIFNDVECPICQGYTQSLQNMYAKYGQKVAFQVVYPTKGVTKRAIRAFEKEYDFQLPFVIDRKRRITNQLKANTMPEVFLVNRKGELIYRGAIDNQWAGLGKLRPKTTEKYLENALEAALNKQTVVLPKTEAIGCPINF